MISGKEKHVNYSDRMFNSKKKIQNKMMKRTWRAQTKLWAKSPTEGRRKKTKGKRTKKINEGNTAEGKKLSQKNFKKSAETTKGARDNKK